MEQARPDKMAANQQVPLANTGATGQPVIRPTGVNAPVDGASRKKARPAGADGITGKTEPTGWSRWNNRKVSKARALVPMVRQGRY